MANIYLEAALVTIEELDDVREVHVVLQDDVPVDFHQRQGDEEDKVTGRDALGCPDGFPDGKHIVVHELWKTQRKAGGRQTRLYEGPERSMCVCTLIM